MQNNGPSETPFSGRTLSVSAAFQKVQENVISGRNTRICSVSFWLIPEVWC